MYFLLKLRMFHCYVSLPEASTLCSQDALVRREAVGGIELRIFHQKLLWETVYALSSKNGNLIYLYIYIHMLYTYSKPITTAPESGGMVFLALSWLKSFVSEIFMSQGWCLQMSYGHKESESICLGCKRISKALLACRPLKLQCVLGRIIEFGVLLELVDQPF